ncbi:LysR family transcriptional regulator [Hyalangium rubrum]|uniref:LysR family transcriptional regulator n=1 Tax=Hyalangium rubrum TaxID=3103134 RepID=A0ABU5HCT2_9BACT|nr:LysR family transcriptional regulator [Hyalangium sp. s54d21]MDY7231274.1 LysR family transcriptional regulator [Hyalangium sp. s54d21]
MDLFSGVLPFLHTAEERSFRKAAAHLGVTTAAVSKAVARLEAELGVTLLNRTSRHVSLTPEGTTFLEHCREAVTRMQAGRELLAQSQKVAEGVLKVSMPLILGRLVVPELGRLGARHPRLSFNLSLTDRFTRMAEEGVDVAVRIGELEDSSLVSRTLRVPQWVTVASPAYLGRHGTPRQAKELERHQCLKFVTPSGVTREWSFRDRREARPVTVRTPDSFRIDNGELMVEASVAGLGICQAFDFVVTEHLRAGRLVEVLAPYAAEGPPIRALCLPRRQNTPRVRVFLDFLQQLLSRER